MVNGHVAAAAADAAAVVGRNAAAAVVGRTAAAGDGAKVLIGGAYVAVGAGEAIAALADVLADGDIARLARGVVTEAAVLARRVRGTFVNVREVF